MGLMKILVGKTAQKDTFDVVTSCFFSNPTFLGQQQPECLQSVEKAVKNFVLMTMIHNPNPHLPWMLF